MLKPRETDMTNVITFRYYTNGEIVGEDEWEAQEDDELEYRLINIPDKMIELMEKIQWPCQNSLRALRGDPTLLNYYTIYDEVRYAFPDVIKQLRCTTSTLDAIWRYIAREEA